jgi:cytochrome oxidase assembly protein ShyY1
MSWRFLRSPKWILRHLLVALLVAAMITAMFWQLRRLHDKRSYKALVEAREEQAPTDVQDLLEAAQSPRDPDVVAATYRPVTAAGTYLDYDTVVVENRTFNGTSGGWVLTPLDLGGGVAVVVNRGFVGYDRAGEIVAPPAPTGTVHVEGLLFPSQHRGTFGATDPREGKLARLARVDLDRFDQQVDQDLLPAYIQLDRSVPGEPPVARDVPQVVALGPPELSEGPHLSYAVQWAIFSTIAVGGYGLLLRRVAKDQAREQGLAAAGGAPAP